MKVGIIAAIFLLAVIGYAFRRQLVRQFYRPTKTFLERGATRGAEAPASSQIAPLTEIIAENLQIPWEVSLLPDGGPEGKPAVSYGAGLLVTERPGTLWRIGRDKKIYTIEGVEHIGEGGLLGMALHPRFIENHLMYLYLTTRSGGGLVNRVERYRWEGDRIAEKKIILEGIPGAEYHDGGRMAFGPDGYLYITTGDAGTPWAAQDAKSLAGKILRVRDDGSIPPNNPFGNAVYSYGHRNAQGIAWDQGGRLWATEHGRSGILSGLDELNLIEKGKNYGWPVIQGDEEKEGMMAPVAQSGPDETWAPAGIAFLDGSLFFGGLRGQALYEARVEEGKITSMKIHFMGQLGRIRAVVAGPDGFLYLATSNTDGRGEPREGDDKVVRVNPKLLDAQ